LKIPSSFVISGTGNGNITGYTSMPELSLVSLWTPPRAALPAPLQSGVKYWTTKTPSSSTYGRLHTTLASAVASTGATTSVSSCIKYSVAGSGEMLTSYDDDASAIAFGTLASALEPFATRVPLGPLCVLVFKIDFDDPTQASVFATFGVNEAVTEQKLLTYVKGLTPAAVNDGSAAWTMFNSAQGHVPIDMDLYEVVLGSSTNAVPDSEIQTLVDYFKTKYRIGSPATQISGAGVVGADFWLSFLTESGKFYRAECSNTLASNSWQTVQDNIEGTGGIVQITDTNGAAQPQRFYRIALPP
jgi:hypothetical protein